MNLGEIEVHVDIDNFKNDVNKLLDSISKFRVKYPFIKFEITFNEEKFHEFCKVRNEKGSFFIYIKEND
ncbi:hypothetical protein MUN88_17205 [Gracilibacillus caseinilyticus]|uniref:Uncharacterized protein n=1 Tax=Gracilibacillus caseinilyticus TaxID=2932256 RepID=A0ABY4ETM3_9BACI|nr:hypothetical protein [Gracilibacillus caseinilyticus]UOQ47770.1 hypothetical protein MUN88_17205 [Gracilibacillus caseinilyticus]